MEMLPDVLRPGLRLVFCGTAASTVSAEAGAYYAGPGNAFWPTLYRVGLTPRQFAPQEFRELLALGIGLTDLAKHESGMDAELSGSAFDVRVFRDKILHFAPAVVAFTSKRAGQEYCGRRVSYGLQPDGIGQTDLYVLPSPSGAARRYWDEAQWQTLADYVENR